MSKMESIETYIETNGIRVLLKRLPGNVKAFSTPNGDGYAVVINDALGPQEQVAALDHELDHIRANHHFTPGYIEYVDELPPTPQPAAKPRYLTLTATLRQDAETHFGLKVSDQEWQAILLAMLFTGAHELEPTRRRNATYYFPPVKVKGGRMYQGPKKLRYSPYLQRIRLK